MASLHQQEGGVDDGLKVPCDQSTNNNTILLPLSPLGSTTTSDPSYASILSHKLIGSDDKPRGLDIFSAGSYSFNNPSLISSTDSLKRRRGATSISADYRFNRHIMQTMSSSDNPSHSLENPSVMTPNDARVVSLSSVPFKWEEAPGKPIISSSADAAAASSSELIPYRNHSSLQLPPKLQCPFESPVSLHQRSPLHQPNFHQRSPLHQPNFHPISPLHQPTNHQSPFGLTHNNPKLKKICRFLLKTASWSQPPHQPAARVDSPPWTSSSSRACSTYMSNTTASQDNDIPENLAIHQRFFFDKASPRDLKHSVSMESWKPALPIFDEYKTDDEFVSREALSFLAVEEHHEAGSCCSPSSPWQPISFHEIEGCASPWAHASSITVHKRPEEEDEDEEEGFHDFFSTASSLEKPSQRMEELAGSACSSPAPWFLDFSPEEEEVDEERRGSKMVVTLVALVKLKRIISSKVCRLKKRREGGAKQQANTTMWSPTLATYLYNQQKEEKESNLISLDYASEEEEQLSDSSSGRLHIDPNYHLPSTIRGHLSPPHYSFSEEEEGGGGGRGRGNSATIPYFSEEEEEEEEEEPPKPPHRLSLREQLSDLDDDDDEEYPPQFVQTKKKEKKKKKDTTTFYPQILDIKRREHHAPSKGLCKVQKTVRMLVATIKLILVQTDVRKRKGPQRTPIKYGSCINPMISPFPSTHK